MAFNDEMTTPTPEETPSELTTEETVASPEPETESELPSPADETHAEPTIEDAAPTLQEVDEPLPKAKKTKKAPAAPLQRTYRTGTKIAAFIFFLITAGIFAIYEYLSFSFLYLPLLESIDNFGEAIAAIFGYIFGLIYTIVFAVAQIPANITAIILFKRLRGRSDKPWENVLFTVMFALSIVMLLVTILSTVLFFAMSAIGG